MNSFDGNVCLICFDAKATQGCGEERVILQVSDIRLGIGRRTVVTQLIVFVLVFMSGDILSEECIRICHRVTQS